MSKWTWPTGYENRIWVLIDQIPKITSYHEIDRRKPEENKDIQACQLLYSAFGRLESNDEGTALPMVLPNAEIRKSADYTYMHSE